MCPMAIMQKQKQKPYKGPKTAPSQVQLPGGIVLKGLPFKIVAYNDDGTPKLFELQPVGSHDLKEKHSCVLFAWEELMRTPWKDGKPGING